MRLRTMANSVRRFIALTLLVAVGLAGVPVNASAFTPSGGVFVADGITYRVLTTPGPSEPGTVQVGDGVNFMNTFSGHLAIPTSVSDGTDDYRVTEIGAYAFAFSGLTSIDIPEGITSIGGGAFRYCSFTSIHLPSTLKTIGGGLPYGGAFDGCSLLTSINLPDGLEVIGERAFYQCALTSVRIPDSVSVVRPGAFASCTSLSSLTIGSGVREIDGQYAYGVPGAFEGCTSLPEVIIPDSLTSIGAGAFQRCESLTNLVLGSGVETIGGGILIGSGGVLDYAGAFQGCSRLGSVALPDGLRELGAAAFSDCGSLQSVTVPDTLTTIGENAFLGCGALAGFEFPDGLMSIGPAAFYACTALSDVRIPAATLSIGTRAFFVTQSMSRIDVAPGNLVYCSVDGVLFNKDKSTLLHYPVPRTGSYAVPAGVTSIGESAFAGSRLAGVVIPDGVVDIGSYAFWGAALDAVKIPDSVVSVGDQAFIACDRLAKVDVGESVRTIGASAFRGCRILESVVLPLSLERLGATAFYDCRALSVLQFNSPTTVIEESWSAHYWGDITIPYGTKIRGYDPSTAKDYATEWGNPFELIGFDPTPEVAGNADANRPIVVLVAGLASDSGNHPVSPYNELSELTGPDYTGDLWSHLGALTADEAYSLGFEDVLIMPTAPDYQHAASAVLAENPCIDSLGPLDFNIRQLADWLEADETIQGHPENPIVLVGHSYGGVISRSMLVSNDDVLSPEIRKRITGIVQFGSPNGGSYSADFASDPGNFADNVPPLNSAIFHASDATDSLSVSAMREWNDGHLNGVGVPVVRFAGTYLPDVIDVMPADVWRWAARTMSDLHGGAGNDGCTALPSIESGYGDLGDDYDGLTDVERDFGGGEITAIATLSHAAGVPGTDQTYDGITYRQLVPQDERGKLLPALATAVASLTSTRVTPAVSPQSVASIAADSVSGAVSATLPGRIASVPAGEGVSVQVALDAPATIVLSSSSGTPTLTVKDSDDMLLNLEIVTDTADGVTTAFARIEPQVPGSLTLTIGLEDGAAGDVAVAGVASGGATLVVREESEPFVGIPAAVTAKFSSSAGIALTGAAVSGSAHCDGVDPIDVTFRDDGLGTDGIADDGIYSASVVFPVAGTWTVGVDAFHTSAERSAVLVTHVGANIASVPGVPAESPIWADGLLASYGVDVPVLVTEDGTYAVSAPVTDSAGTRLGTLTSSGIPIEASETTTLTASIAGSALAGMASGPLTVGPIRITRYTDGVELLVGLTPGFTTSASYSADDVYDFSITLSGPAANPSPTGAVHFTGTAHNTPSTVASVEYSIDGSTTWQPLEALDGAFDSSHEDFAVDLMLPDYVYGIYVRQTGADGVQLPVADWAGIRFTVDTVAPGQPTGAAALIAGEAGSQTADVSWFAADPPSDITSLVSYQVRLDGADVGTTCGTDFDVPLPDGGLHTISITPVDLAGNVGPSSVLELGVPVVLPPVTTLIADPTTPDGENGWYLTSPGITFSTDVAATTYYAWDSGVPAAVTGVLTAPDGEHTLSYYSAVNPDNPEDAQSAVFKVDTVSPGAPAGLQAEAAGPNTIDLSWDAVVDGESGTAGYLVYSVDGTLLGEPTSNAFSVTSLAPVTYYSFYIKAKDNAGRVGDASAVVGDTTGNTAPVLTPIGAKSVSEGSTLAFTATATDADLPAQTLTFSLGAGAPAGAVISAGGAFSWTPTEAQGPGLYDITITVSDGTASDSETIAVTVSEVPDPVTLTPVYRFYNITNGTHFYTNSTTERDHVIATWPHIYQFEGPVYNLNPANNTQPLTRLYNKVSGSHFYTASPSEAADALAKWPSVFSLDGPTYAVNPAKMANSLPVYRFYNLKNGSHFYTASETEKNEVIAKWPDVYKFEGPVFYIGQ